MRTRWIVLPVVLPVVLAAGWAAVRSEVPAAVAAWRTNACGDSAIVTWEPARPTRGTLFRVTVRGVPDESVLAGRVSGQPLHFDAATAGERASLAAIPIDGPAAVRIAVTCTAGRRTDSLVVSASSGAGEYQIERLRVAPAFGQAPDSALAARTRRESRRAQDVADASHGTPRLWREPFTRPRPSRITSGFGHGREFNGTITSRHMGTDFAGVTGAPVLAANRGVVRIVDGFYYGGNVVYLDHGAGVTSAYLHLSEQLVAVGDTVERGQPVGQVGATGRVTGPHLHLIIRYGTITVDPVSLFAIAGDSAR